jgi:hypothetical protein
VVWDNYIQAHGLCRHKRISFSYRNAGRVEIDISPGDEFDHKFGTIVTERD